MILLLLASAATAADLKGRVTAIDLGKRTVAIKVAEQDQTVDLATDCKVYKHTGGGPRESGFSEAPGGLKAVAIGDEVTATTDFLDGTDQVIRIKIETPAKKRRQVGRDVPGKVAAIDPAKRSITLTIDDKDQKYELAKDCNVFKLIGSGRLAHYELAPGGLNDVTVGAEVALNLDTRQGKEQVVYIQIGPTKKKRDK